MIKVAICDDEKVITSQIETTIFDVYKFEGISVDIDVFLNGAALEKEISNGTSYDLIYLDIQMANGDGITTAKNIRAIDENALLIYVSGYDKYMMELFRLDVLIYFPFRYKNQEYKILCNDILYFESRGRKIIIYIRDGSTETFNAKLSEVEKSICDGKIPFLRIHQSYLVNYHHIKSRSKTEITLINGTNLPISEDRQKSFGRQYSLLLGGEMDA